MDRHGCAVPALSGFCNPVHGRQALADLGYPSYLVPILTAMKILAVAAILSRVSVTLSDLAYAGMLYHLLLSASAHIGVRKPSGALPAALGLVLLIASFATQNAVREVPSPYAPGAVELPLILN